MTRSSAMLASLIAGLRAAAKEREGLAVLEELFARHKAAAPTGGGRPLAGTARVAQSTDVHVNTCSRGLASPPAAPTEEANWWGASWAVQEAFLASYSPATRTAYAVDLRDLNAYADRLRRAPLELARGELADYVQEMIDGRGLAASTVRRRIAAIGGMYRWATEEGVLERNPAARLRRPRPSTPPPRVRLSTTELVHLLHAAEQHSDRTGVLVFLLFGHGLRVGEALGLDVADVRAGAPPTVLVTGKAGVQREIQLSGRLNVLLRRLGHGHHDGPVLRSRTGRRLHRSDAARLLRTVALTALPEELALRLHPHAGRAAFTFACLEQGVPLRDLQHALGHRSPGQTLWYADQHHHHATAVPDRLERLLRVNG